MIQEDYVKLVKDARNNDRSFGILLEKMNPLVHAIALRMSKSYHIDIDDLKQDAIIGIWKALSKVKLNRPKTIQKYLIVAAINGMKANIVLFRRKNKFHVVSYDDIKNTEVSPLTHDKPKHEFYGLLLKYVKFIEYNGTMHGAHRFLAKRVGVSPQTMTKRFNRAVRLLLEEER